MLHIEYERGVEEVWHVGKPFTKRSLQVREVQADGHELDAIFAQFKNIIRHESARVQTWTGETAQFIVNHLL